MKITDIKVYQIGIPLRKTFKTSVRSSKRIENIIINVFLEDGKVGYGEAAPHTFVTGETQESIRAAILKHIKPAIVGLDIENMEEVMSCISNSILGNTGAKAAVDIAIYDLYGQYLNRPLHEVLGGKKESIESDITISINNIEQMKKDCLEAIQNGYKTLKIKLGSNYNDDIKRIMEIRKTVGTEIKLRLDANQAWKPKDAVRIINKMEDKGLDIELVEQPVHFQDIGGMAFVTKNVLTPILADESVVQVRDAIEIIKAHAADLINIKLMKTGGIYNAIKICHIAEAYGIECMIGCMLESKISIGAAAHLAASKRIITKIDLDSYNLSLYDPFIVGPIFDNSLITLNSAPGLGITGIKNNLSTSDGNFTFN